MCETVHFLLDFEMSSVILSQMSLSVIDPFIYQLLAFAFTDNKSRAEWHDSKFHLMCVNQSIQPKLI